MSGLSDTLAALARGGGQLLRVPTALLLGWAGLVLLVLALEVWALLGPAGGPGPVGSALLVALVALLAVPVVVLAVRRRRWLRLTRQASAEAASATVVVGGSTDLVTIDALGDRVEDEISGMDGEEDVRAVMDAFTEIQQPEASSRGAGARMTRALGVGRLAVIGRVFGRMERAQRALLAAAGGPVRAPYLVDDLRVTVAALLGTVATAVVGGLAALVLAAVLLAR
ncbi:hypothetical protein [Actinotalea caeni]|uniref:hypothetical protein n=1 Tax=Actinotalea caeni TaxID=1348467 RepID=UPI0012E18BA0|nr:hypothetical protein [Actinotalea caeni]